MKKILVFSLAYYPSHVSGAEAAIKEITDRIDSSDIEFHLITLKFDHDALKEERLGNILVHRIGFGNYFGKILYIPLATLKARRLHKKYAFNAMWSVMTYMLFPVALSRLLGMRIPHILTLQDGDPYDKVFNRWFIKPITPLLNYGFRTAKIVQVISNYLGEWPAKRGYRGEVVLIRNGANPKNISNDFSREEAEKVKEKLSKSSDQVNLFVAARLVHQKGLDNVIKALSLLPSHIHFIIAGGGPDEEMLKDTAVKEGVESRVTFLGPLDREDVPNYRNTIVSDIFVHPSRSEGLGNSVLSAMAAKLPVVATQEGGLGEFVFDEKRNPDKATTAWAVDKDSPEQIAQAVKDILDNPKKVEEVTKNAREMVVTEFNWEIIAKDMKTKVFDKVLR